MQLFNTHKENSDMSNISRSKFCYCLTKTPTKKIGTQAEIKMNINITTHSNQCCKFIVVETGYIVVMLHALAFCKYIHMCTCMQHAYEYEM